jgi:hypothetical protein
MLRRRVKRTRGGRFQLNLAQEERILIQGLLDQLRTILESDDPGLRRVFPPAYTDEPEAEAEYRRLMHGDLVERHLVAFDTVSRTLQAKELDEEQLSAWLAAVHDIRLVLGTRLGVTEETLHEDIDPGDPAPPALALYDHLSGLEWEVVEALAGP